MYLLEATIDPTANSGFTTVQIASVLLGTVLPILVGLVTKTVTNASVKAVILLALSAVAGFLTELISNGNFVWQQAVLTSLITFVTAVAMHFGFWRPTGVTEKAQRAFGGQ
jgi:lysylphosphatidylglycerol synthetase-like protein (DUF2156 family)